MGTHDEKNVWGTVFGSFVCRRQRHPLAAPFVSVIAIFPAQEELGWSKLLDGTAAVTRHFWQSLHTVHLSNSQTFIISY